MYYSKTRGRFEPRPSDQTDPEPEGKITNFDVTPGEHLALYILSLLLRRARLLPKPSHSQRRILILAKYNIQKVYPLIMFHKALNSRDYITPVAIS